MPVYILYRVLTKEDMDLLLTIKIFTVGILSTMRYIFCFYKLRMKES